MQKLVERLAQGEPAAFAELYDACADRLHHYLALRLGSREDADDVLQSTFVRLAQARQRLAGIQNLIAYVFQVARNESADFRGRKGRESEFLNAHACDLFRIDASVDQSAREDAEYVVSTLARLTVEQREIVELKIYGKFTFSEIGEILGVPQGTAATRYRTALERMRSWCLEERQ